MALTTFELRSRISVGGFLGYVQGISLPTVLQMIELEKTTCTVCVYHGDDQGRMHFRDGQLIDVDAGPLTGETAAYEILTWPSADIEIRTFAGERRQRIQAPLAKILIDSSRRFDERRHHAEDAEPREIEPHEIEPSEAELNDAEPLESEPAPALLTLVPMAVAKVQDGTMEIAWSRQAGHEEEMSVNSLHKVLDSFRQEVPEFVSTDIVNVDSGLSIGGGSIDPDFDASIAAASYAEVVKANGRALELLGLGATTTEDILISTERVYVLIRPMGAEYYHVVAVGRKGNLGLSRAIMKKYEPKLLSAIGELA